MFETQRLGEALETLGAVLQERGLECALLIAGGSTLLLLGLVARPTADVDVLGLATPQGYERADRLPPFLAEAVREVAQALGLAENWINCGPAGLLELGLPPGMEQRVTIRRYGGLELHLPDRSDLICFKLYAAADQGERSKHFADLQVMVPTTDELKAAARWARTHDSSPGFLHELRRIVAILDEEATDAC